MVDEFGLGDVLLNGALQLGIHLFALLYAGEQVVDEGDEQGLVLVDQLGQVHVAQHSHDDHLLRVIHRLPLHRAQSPQHRQDVT